MTVFETIDDLQFLNESCKPISLALGTFDGIHLGHQKVITETIKDGFLSVVFAIERPFSGSQRTPYHITEKEEKIKILSDMGVDVFINLPFYEFSNFTPEEFVRDILRQLINAQRIVCGFNFHFGKNASGDSHTLEELCQKYDMELVTVPAVLDGDSPISSSRIRQALSNGYVDTAERMLGRPFCISFLVVGGDRLGRKLGFPTINQQLPESFIRPMFGVYAAYAVVNGESHPAVCNIGTRPTVSGSTAPRAETYIIDFKGDLYGSNTPVYLVKFLRPEIKFNGLDALTSAIKTDAEIAKKIYDIKYIQNGDINELII